MAESKFQSNLKKEIIARWPTCFIQKTDPSQCQGISDLVILFDNGRWAFLECKDSASSPYRPNQEWYLAHFAGMSYAHVIYPENKEEVLDEMERTLGLKG